MDRKYSLAYLTIPGTDPVSQIHIAKDAGYDFVSLRTIPMHLPGEPEFVLEKDEKLLSDIKAALKETGMKVHDIELVRFRPELNVSELEPAFEKAAEIGATDVLSSVWTRDKAIYNGKVAETAALAAKYGLKVNVEFLPWAGIRSLQEDITLVDNMRALGHDNVFVMLDTLHAGRAGVTKEEVKRTPGDYFGFIHLCDGPAGPDGDPVLADIHDELMLYTAREARFYAGEGAMDVKGLIDALPGHDISIELPNLKKMQELGAAGHAKMCLDTAKKCLG